MNEDGTIENIEIKDEKIIPVYETDNPFIKQ